jgi:hypothetical protein
MKIDQKSLNQLENETTHFLLCAFTASSQQGIEVPTGEEYNLSIKINGVELPVEEVIRYVYSRLNTDLDARAAQLLKKKFRGVKDLLEELVESVTEKMEDSHLKVCDLLKVLPN